MEYLYYKIQRITRYSDTSSLNVHVPFVMTGVIFFYIVDFWILYHYIIMGYPPYKDMGGRTFGCLWRRLGNMAQPILLLPIQE